MVGSLLFSTKWGIIGCRRRWTVSMISSDRGPVGRSSHAEVAASAGVDDVQGNALVREFERVGVPELVRQKDTRTGRSSAQVGAGDCGQASSVISPRARRRAVARRHDGDHLLGPRRVCGTAAPRTARRPTGQITATAAALTRPPPDAMRTRSPSPTAARSRSPTSGNRCCSSTISAQPLVLRLAAAFTRDRSSDTAGPGLTAPTTPSGRPDRSRNTSLCVRASEGGLAAVA